MPNHLSRRRALATVLSAPVWPLLGLTHGPAWASNALVPLVQDQLWHDAKRARNVPIRLRWPPGFVASAQRRFGSQRIS